MISKALAVINPERCCVMKGASGLASILERKKEPSMLPCIVLPASAIWSTNGKFWIFPNTASRVQEGPKEFGTMTSNSKDIITIITSIITSTCTCTTVFIASLSGTPQAKPDFSAEREHTTKSFCNWIQSLSASLRYHSMQGVREIEPGKTIARDPWGPWSHLNTWQSTTMLRWQVLFKDQQNIQCFPLFSPLRDTPALERYSTTSKQLCESWSSEKNSSLAPDTKISPWSNSLLWSPSNQPWQSR